MRDYAKVAPQFWTGKTGRALKAKGPEAVIVGLYLMTCQHANMLGLYYLSQTYVAVDTGLGLEGASKGLAGACEAGFCQYDEGSEVVWVTEMAAYQIGDQLEVKDNRCKGVQREYDMAPENPFLAAFYERYSGAFHMTACRGKPKPPARGSKAPPKPGTGAGERTGARAEAGTSAGTGLVSGAAAAPAGPKGAATWDSYSLAYERRYGTQPVRNAAVNSQLAKLVDKLGADEAPLVASHYVGSQNSIYVGAGHCTELLLRDAAKLRTEWFTGRQGFRKQAVEADRIATDGAKWSNVLQTLQAEQVQ
jgi:hypothetical protein